MKPLLFLAMLAVIMITRPAAAQEAGYTLNPGDLLRISVWREDELDREALIQPDGSVSFPLVGSVGAAGRTATELQNDIAANLDRFIPDAVVTVELLEARGNIVYVLGEVNKPGAYQLGSSISLVQAISLAGGFTPFAGTGRIKVMRKDANGEVAIPVDYDDIESGTDLSADLTLKAGDTVVVPGGSIF